MAPLKNSQYACNRKLGLNETVYSNYSKKEKFSNGA